MMTGKKALEMLAHRYPQLYLDPNEEGAEDACRAAVQKGNAPAENSLSHFHCEECDNLETVETPAGSVEVLTLYNRADFELFLRIMAYHCAHVEIPRTQGAVTLDGIVNWRKIEAHRASFFQEQAEQGILFPDWTREFKAFTSEKQNYRDTLIVLSMGPYSGIDSGRMGLTEDAWITASHTIRKYHECTHVICRRQYPEQIDPIWDELVADAVGLYAAFGRYDLRAAACFLGVEEGRYTGGRLQNYVPAPQDSAGLDALAGKVYTVLRDLETVIRECPAQEPFDLIPVLQNRHHLFKSVFHDTQGGTC